MKEHDVPQQAARAYMGQRKALYAINEQGEYTIVPSAGWEAEEIVLLQAIEECDRLAADAHARAQSGLTGALEYHMCRQRMDLMVLAQSTGFFRWQVRRHLRPGAFAKLSAGQQQRYESALGLTVRELETLPAAP